MINTTTTSTGNSRKDEIDFPQKDEKVCVSFGGKQRTSVEIKRDDLLKSFTS